MIKSGTMGFFSSIFKSTDNEKDPFRDKNYLPIGRHRNIPLSLIPRSFFLSFLSPLSRTVQRRETIFPACLYDYTMKVWIHICQIWALISMRNWPEEDSLHFYLWLFTSFLRKDSKSMYFLSEHWFVQINSQKTGNFITCFLKLVSWHDLWRSKCWFFITEINRIFVGLQSGPRSRHVQTQFMVTCQTCELYGFYSLSLNDSMAEFPRCFWKVTSVLHFLSKEQNSPITADSEG